MVLMDSASGALAAASARASSEADEIAVVLQDVISEPLQREISPVYAQHEGMAQYGAPHVVDRTPKFLRQRHIAY